MTETANSTVPECIGDYDPGARLCETCRTQQECQMAYLGVGGPGEEREDDRRILGWEGPPSNRIRWEWQRSIRDSDLRGVTKAILLTLSLRMDGYGCRCYPSINKIAVDSGFTPRTVMTHLSVAINAGFLEVRESQKSLRREYRPRFPKGGTR